MKKIGILALATPKHGGTFQYTLSMIKALKQLDNVQCEIFTTAANHEYDALELPIHRLPNPIGTISSFIATHIGICKKNQLFKQVDIVVSPIYSTYLLASFCPFVFTLHDLQEKYYPQNFSLVQRVWRHVTNQLLIKKAAAVICESSYVKQDIVRFFSPPAEKIFIVPAPPAISQSESEYSEEHLAEIRTKYSLPMEYLFYPAQFWPHKNHYRLVQAFSQIQQKFPDCSLVLTGKKRDEYQKVFNLINELAIEEKVVHIEYIEQEDLAAIYKLAIVAVIPTLFESISIPAYEAFSFGTPICISNVVALPEQIGDAGLLFTPTSVEDIQNCIEKALSNPSLRTELIAKGKARIAGLTHENYADKLQAIFNSIIVIP
jgi:glycosyltransferase involved in cell wall biosynthesis